MNSPLEGIRVLHLTANFPGPLAASKLARAGAQVTKIESPQRDPLERGCPAWYADLHQGQTIKRLDLKTPEDRAQLEPLLAESHLFLTSFRPKALSKLALGWVELHARHPRLSMVRLQGFFGMREDQAAHDLILQAEAGLLTPPALPRALVADSAAAEMTFSASLLALFEARSSPSGTLRVVTLAEGADEFRQPWVRGLTRPEGPLGGALPAYGIYRAREGWVALAALESSLAQRFEELFGVRVLDRDGLVKLFLTRSASEWADCGRKEGLPLTALAALM